MKRLTNKQNHRANYKFNDDNLEVVDFLRVSISIPYIDNFVSQLELRFLDHETIFEGKLGNFNVIISFV